MNSLYEKENLLPYVTEENIPASPKASIFKPKLNKNTLGMTAFVVSLVSIVFGFIFSILGITLGTGALILAAKKGLPKKIPLISMAVSFTTLILSTVLTISIVNTFTPPSDPYIPPSYTYDEGTGIAYKYNPLSGIPCDANGKCVVEVKLFPIDSKCVNGGTFTADMQDMISRVRSTAPPSPFPALTSGEDFTFTVELIAMPHSKLIEANPYPISCT